MKSIPQNSVKSDATQNAIEAKTLSKTSNQEQQRYSQDLTDVVQERSSEIR